MHTYIHTLNTHMHRVMNWKWGRAGLDHPPIHPLTCKRGPTFPAGRNLASLGRAKIPPSRGQARAPRSCNRWPGVPCFPRLPWHEAHAR